MADKRKCPKCGAEVYASDDVCMDCGTDLTAARRPPAPERDQGPGWVGAPEAPPVHEAPARTQAPRAPAPMGSWLWVPPLRSPTRYPVLRTYQYVCMLSAWGSLISGVGEAVALMLAWGSLRSLMPGVPAELDLVAVVIVVGTLVLWSLFWAFTLRAAVEAIQVYLDIEENTRRTSDAAERTAEAATALSPSEGTG